MRSTIGLLLCLVLLGCDRAAPAPLYWKHGMITLEDPEAEIALPRTRQPLEPWFFADGDLRAYRQDRDILLVDQRGMGRSNGLI